MDEFEIVKNKLKLMNLAKVAKECGVSREIISRFMRSEKNNISAKVFLKLKEVLKILGE